MNRNRLLASVIVVTMAFVAYRRAISAYFFDDDFQWLVGTWTFTPRQLVDIAQRQHFYRPVIDVYFAAAAPLFNGSPALFHIANIALHAANGLVLLALARTISGSLGFAFLTALFFVVQPGDVEAVAWVSALAEPISAFFGCLALLWFVRFRRTSRWPNQAVSIAAFTLALVTHESSIVFAPLMFLADWAFCVHLRRGAATADNDGLTRPDRVSRLLRVYLPYAIVAAVYLCVDIFINSRNYVVTQGHYALGRHAIVNTVDYISALYVGRGNVWNYAAIAIGFLALFVKGSRRVVFAAAWVVLALLPFVFFTWSNTSRYLYLPAMGFSMLLAEAILQLDRVLARRVGAAWRRAIVVLLVAAIAGRFTAFAIRNVNWFAERTEDYRRYITQFREIHGDVPSHARIAPDPRLRSPHANHFLSALVQWEYRDPTIELIPD